MAATEPTDFEKMLDEMNIVRKKFDLPKGMLFAPDRLEISIQRVSYDNFHLSIREFYDYLPDNVLDTTIPQTIDMMTQTSLSGQKVTRVDKNCLKTETDGNLLLIVGSILMELFNQKRFEEAEYARMHLLVSVLQRLRMAFADFFDLKFEWDSETEKTFYSDQEKETKFFQEHPSALAEIEAIVKKYTKPSETQV